MQVVWICAQISIFTPDGKEINAQQHRGALGRASLTILDSSSGSIASGELPSAVAGQAVQVLARDGAQCKVELAMCVGHVLGVCQRVVNGETSGGAFLLPLQVPASPNHHQCATVRLITLVRMFCSN